VILNMLSAVEESEEVYRLSEAERKAVEEGLKVVPIRNLKWMN